MEKIIFLDWDGPVSNTRTWKMPGQVDPVAIQLLNDLTVAGWKTVLSSTIRAHFFCDDLGGPRASEQAREAATQFMRDRGFNVRWYEYSWCTSIERITKRHLEVVQWMMDTPLPEDAVFMVIDDEHFPHDLLERGRMTQCHARSDSGIDYLSISEAYRIGEMTDAQLAEHFEVDNEPDDEGDL